MPSLPGSRLAVSRFSLRRLAPALVLVAALAWGGPASAVELSTDSFTLVFGDDGRPASAIRKTDGVDLVQKRNGDEGFSLRRPNGAVVRLEKLSLDAAGKLIAA
ncbi:MAG TPA: hypothetical protein VGE52_03670, partial [Pirellulales bacterium]